MKLPVFTSLGLAVLAGISLVTPALAVITTTDSFGSGGNTFTMDFVTVGNPGNAANTTGAPSPAGAVAYTYRIGSYEVSRDMVSKANSAGSLGISLADLAIWGGNGANRPATGVSWNEAARFVNYLNVSSGSVAAYKFSTQPGDVGYGANFDLVLWASGDAGNDASNPFRNSLAKYFLPSENEWHKAAYYGSSGIYYNYATGSDTIPTVVASGTIQGTAVYGQFFDNSAPADVTSAGGLSPYGTMGQGGNAFEWMESESDGVNNSAGSLRGLRGGAWSDNDYALSASYYNHINPSDKIALVGFRVASVPEPTSLLLMILASGVMLIRRKR